MCDEKTDEEKDSISPTQRMRNLTEWGILHFLADANDNPEVKREELRGKAKKYFVSAVRNRTRRYLAERINDEKGLTKKRSKEILEKFAVEGLTSDILEARPEERKMYFVGLNVRLNKYTMEQFVKEVFKRNAYIELATAVLGTHDCIIGLYCSQSQLTDWLWKELRGFEKTGAQVINTTTYSTYSEVQQRFDPRDHPKYPEISQERFNHRSDNTN